MNITKDVYRKVLTALREGPKSSEEILRECGFSDTFHCSSALSILVRQGLIAKGYRLTESGRQAIAKPEDQGADDTQVNPSRGPIPPIPRPASPGFEWIFDEQRWEWIQHRKPEFDPIRRPRESRPSSEANLFG